MEIPEITFQCTKSLMFSKSTNATPNVTMNCIKDANDPLIAGSAISTMYNGEASANAPPPNPGTRERKYQPCHVIFFCLPRVAPYLSIFFLQR